MESIGKYLKAERESQKLSLQQVSESTKIREHLLRAIEEDRYDRISSPVYVKGFLDAYARCLGLDSNEIILQYHEKYAKKTPPKGTGLEQRRSSPRLEKPTAFSGRRVILWLLIIATSVAILLTAMIIYRISLNPRHGSPGLSKEESPPTLMSPVPSPPPVQGGGDAETTSPGLTPVPSMSSPSAIQEKADTETTSPPEESEKPKPMGSKNRGAKPSLQKRAVQKGEGDR